MILTFSIPEFPDAIMTGIKIHTIRRDTTQRWRPGMSINFWFGNPRNIKSVPPPFAFGTSHDWTVTSIQSISIWPATKLIYIDGRLLPHDERRQLAIHDGFKNLGEFWNYFTEPFSGRLIHWTEKKY